MLLLLALPARAEDREIGRLIRQLEHPDPSLRRSAQAELARIGAPAVGPVFALIDSGDTEVRRFAHRLIGRQLRGGTPEVRPRSMREGGRSSICT